ncbi:MAG TPA: hypothetical protein VE691_17465 [Rubrobacter sp.]|nr:hypothetical protein [Rubrobacter sp.]
MHTMAVFGSGDVGEAVLRFSAADPGISKLWALDLDERRAEVAVNEAAAIAAHRGRAPEFNWRTVDMTSREQIGEALTHIQPDVVVQTATLQSWWVLSQLPSEQYRRLAFEARFGPWLPLHLLPAMRLMEACAEVGIEVPVVNVAFPDGVNPVLGGLGLTPATGAGNSDLLHPGIRCLVARRLGVPVTDVDVRLLAHHNHVDLFWTGLEEVEDLNPSTFWLRVAIGGEDRTDEVDPSELLREAGRLLPKGRAIAQRTASSAAKNALLLLGETPVRTHTSAPVGMVGGYDVLLSKAGVEILWPEPLSPDEAKAINERAQVGDSIERIEDDGTVHFTETAASVMHEVLGYDCKVLHPEDAEARATELRERLATLTTSHTY